MIYCVNEINHMFCVPFLSDLLAFLIPSIFMKTLSRNEGSAKLSHFFFQGSWFNEEDTFSFLILSFRIYTGSISLIDKSSYPRCSVKKTSEKRHSNTGVSRWNLRNFQVHLFSKTSANDCFYIVIGEILKLSVLVGPRLVIIPT